MKQIIGFWLLFSTPFGAIAQELEAYMLNNIAVIEHRVQGGETVESVSRLFNADKMLVTRLNNLGEESGVRDGQVLVVPVSQSLKAECSGPNCVKIYHKVAPKEGLYRIGLNYGNIKTPQLKQLNNLDQESVSIGQRILVGYLEMDRAVNHQKSVKYNTQELKKGEGQNHLKKQAESESVLGASAPVTKENLSKVAAQTKAVSEPLTESQTPAPNQLQYAGKGFFESQFLDGKNNIDLEAACFKSLSGWEDGKFYVLMNGVDAGRIIKLHNLQTNQYVFAKVLAPLPAIKKNNHISLRMSNATAAALGIGEEAELTVRVQY